MFVPSAPLLVPELSGSAATDTVPARDAAVSALAAAATDTDHWLALGAADSTPAPTCTDLASVGSFRGYGVDVAVRLQDAPPGTPVPSPSAPLPLSMLIAGWLRGQVGIPLVTPCVVAPDATPEECTELGRLMAERISSVPERVSVLAVADGAFALSPKAPGGGLRQSAVDLQTRIDAAIAAGDPEALGALPVGPCVEEGVAGRPAWQVVAALCAGRQMHADVAYAAAPFGVGYTVATWSAR